MTYSLHCRSFSSAWGLRSAVLMLLTLSTTLCAPSFLRAQSAPTQSVLRTRAPQLPAQAPIELATATFQGSVAPTAPIAMTLVLPLHNASGLDDLISRLYDPHDALYGKYLTSAQFDAQYGPAVSEVNLVTSYAQAHGFVINSISDSRCLIHVTGTAAAVTSAFGCRVDSYLGTDGRQFMRPDQAPVVPSDLVGHIVAVTGLDQTIRPVSHVHLVRPPVSSPAALPQVAQPLGFYSSDPAGLTPSDIHTVYNVPRGGYNGMGQTLGLFELATYTPGDITTYESTYALGNVPLSNVGVNGFNTATAPGDGADEATLDIELQIALAPSAAGIIIYEDSNSIGAFLDIFDKMASDDKATTISTSWGFPADLDSSEATAENIPLARMAAQGQSFFAAAGDAGAYDNQEVLSSGGSLSVDDPASQPYVTGVGGTNLNNNPDITYSSETAWGDPQDTGRGPFGTGGGGGISSIWRIPSWQVSAINTAVNPQGSTTMRNVPDVSLFGDYDANEYSIYFTPPGSAPGFFGANGTSAAAPLWSAFAALVNQARKTRHFSSIGFMNPALYAIGANSAKYGSDFHDINDGSTNLYYHAVTGYDNATGLGSFIGLNLLNDLINVVTPPVISSFRPTFGPVGTLVTITGNSFQGATQVTFNGTPASYTVVSNTTITATVPAGATSGPITVTTPNGSASSATNFDLPPVITSFSPTSGTYGTVVTISGINFLDTEGVTFAGTGNSRLSAAFTVLSNTTITAIVPVGAVTGTIIVVAPAGAATSATNFTVTLPTPTIVSFSPTTGPVTTSVTITGTSLFSVDAVTFNGVPTTFTASADGTTVTAVVPLAATTGPISITTPGGVVSTLSIPAPGAQVFTVVNPVPTIIKFTPTSGPALTSVTITGTGFYGVQTVTFNNTAAAGVTTVSPAQIVAIVPNTATTGPIRVTTVGGTAVSAASFVVTSVPPRITGFSPTVAAVNATVSVIGVGFGGTTAVTINGVAAAFTVVSDGSLTFEVPAGATTGPIRVTKGTSVSVSTNNLVIVSQITGFSPLTGPVGTVVTITGTSFTGLSAVRFNGVTATVFHLISSTQAQATVPAGAQTGPISIQATAGQAFSAMNYTVGVPPAALPTIVGLSPAGGPAGTVVTVTGTNFTGATSVKFNGVTAAYVVVNATTITATAPMGSTSGPITVVTPAGTAVSLLNFDYPPTITGFSPISGSEGTVVTITGTNLKDATAVFFNGVDVQAGSINALVNGTLTIMAPVSTTGLITVVTPGGTATSTAKFDYPPAITNFSPASGPAGTVVTITGVNFFNTSSVTFNGVAASFTIVSNTSLRATAPTGAATGAITVTAPGGTASTTDISPQSVFYYPPVITSFAPASGQAQTVVTITGANLSTVAPGTTTVSFNGTTATVVQVSANGTSLTVAVPIGATTGLIRVTTPGGTAQTATSFTVLPAFPVPTITSFTPTSGLPGTSVTITGTGFSGTVGTGGQYTTISVVFGSVPATSFTVNMAGTQITATVPVGVTTGPIQVTTTGGTATSAVVFNGPPILLNFTPTVGGPPTLVTINGLNFTPGTVVTFNGVAATVTFISSTQVSATVPAAATTGPLTLATAYGTVSSAPALFYVPPTITSFTPTSGLAGTTVTITGTNFLGATNVTFNGLAAAFTVVSNTEITATVPAGGAGGPIVVTTPAGTATSTGSFSVRPIITGFTPTNGTVGTTVTILGSNFTGETSVTFNGLAASVTNLVNDGTITAVVPPGATTGPISVTTSGGTATTSGVFTVVVQTPKISGFSPNSAVIGSTVTIIGSGLINVNAAFFNGVAATILSVTNTQVVVTVPVGATSGLISVTTSTGPSAASGSSFLVLPAITALAPASGSAGSSVVITGSALSGATIVRFNGLSAAFTINSPTHITAVVPTGAASGRVSVATPSGTAFSATSFTLTP